jgi:hypothetical protein
MTPTYALSAAGLAGTLAYVSEEPSGAGQTAAAVGGAALAGLGADLLFEDANYALGSILVAIGVGVCLAAR